MAGANGDDRAAMLQHLDGLLRDPADAVRPSACPNAEATVCLNNPEVQAAPLDCSLQCSSELPSDAFLMSSRRAGVQGCILGHASHVKTPHLCLQEGRFEDVDDEEEPAMPEHAHSAHQHS